MKKFCGKVSDLLAPPVTCIVCGEELTEDSALSVCTECLCKLSYNNERTCEICGRKTETLSTVCNVCRGRELSFRRAGSAFCYEGEARRLLHRFKFEDERYLAEFFASQMVSAFIREELAADAVTFVPMTKWRRWQRGYNQAELLARRYCELMNLPFLPGLKKIRPTKKQASLTGEDRRRNVESAFAVTDAAIFCGKRILLIDDVLTTGSTASACSAAIKKGGATSVDVLTACSVPELKP